MAGLGKTAKRRLAKAVSRSPQWLQTVQVSKPARDRVRGSFGAASVVTHIDPATGLPRGEA